MGDVCVSTWGYVLTTEDGTMAGDGVIDLYAARDGTYLHSWRLPSPWLSLAEVAPSG